mgnify:CR=1 FL=1
MLSPALYLPLQSGASRRTDLSAFLDVFSYLSNKSRRAVAQHMTPSRGAFDTATQSFMGEAEVGGSLLAGDTCLPAGGTCPWASWDSCGKGRMLLGGRTQVQASGSGW